MLWPHDAGDLVVHADHGTEHASAGKVGAIRVPDHGLAELRESAPVAAVEVIHVEGAESEK
jgi:hypothetical protein